MKSNLHKKMSFRVPKAKIKGEVLPGDYHVAECGYIGRKGSQKATLGVPKRASPYKSSFLDAYTRKSLNVEAVNKEGKRHGVRPAIIRKKVGAVAYTREIPSKKYTNDFLNERVRGYSDLERANIRNESDNDACSVGSCSVDYNMENTSSNCSTKLPCLGRGLLLGDTRSFYCTCHKENRCHCLEEKVRITVHSLEMHAYRSTLEALYASGPLSWEQEELLTNLRIMLHISNDEHLTELRSLIPSGTSK